MTFTIKGCAHGESLAHTRARPASAAVLAMNWMAAGIEDVRIEQDGRSFDLTAFRQQFLLNKRRRDTALTGI